MDYQTIIKDLRRMVGQSKADHADELGDIRIQMSEERAFLSEADRDSDAIFLIVSFGDATTNYGATALPFDITAYGLQDEMDKTMSLLSAFASEHNLERTGNGQYIITLPTVPSAFGEEGSGYRALVAMTGYAVLQENGLSIKSLKYTNWDGDEEELKILTFQDDTTQTLSPQVYHGSDGRAKSYATGQAYGFTISVYSSADSLLLKDIVAVRFGDDEILKKKFRFTLEFQGGGGFANWEFTLKTAQYTQRIGELPSWVFGFTL